MLYQLPNVKFAQTTWAGVNMLFESLDPSKPQPHFKVSRYVDPYFGELMSNYVIAQIINIERGFYLYRDKQKTSEWSRPFFPDFRVLSDLTIGILGSGNLGSSVGKLLKSAGCHVVAFVRKTRDSESDCYTEATTDLNDVLARCDYICNVLPSTEETKGLLDGEVLKYCKKKPVFMNIGRGNVIKEETIIKALNEHWISKAVLDVFVEEPLPSSSPLWKTPEVYITPHVGAIPRIDGIAHFIADNFVRYAKGDAVVNLLDWGQGY